MLIVFGTRFCGKIAEVNGQWIESKFFSIMFIPIFPVDSMGAEFRKRNGFTIGVNSKSVKAVYGRLLSLIFAAWFFFVGYTYLVEGWNYNKTDPIIYLALGILSTALCIYFYFYYGKASADDIVLRNKMGYLTGYYILPHLFDYGQLRNMLGSLELEYKQKYPDNDWKADLKNDNISPDKYMLLFGLALFNCMVYDIPENDELFKRADQLILQKS